MGSPTFVAHFADGEVTRMTTYTLLDPLDVGRGVRLARHAYRSRKKIGPAALTPAIVEGSFERFGQTIATYDTDALDAVSQVSRRREVGCGAAQEAEPRAAGYPNVISMQAWAAGEQHPDVMYGPPMTDTGAAYKPLPF